MHWQDRDDIMHHMQGSFRTNGMPIGDGGPSRPTYSPPYQSLRSERWTVHNILPAVLGGRSNNQVNIVNRR